MDAVTSSWTPPATAPIPARANRTAPPPIAPRRPVDAAATPLILPGMLRRPIFLEQIGLGLAIFAAVLATSVPLAFVSQGLALATAIGVGSVLVALLARRLRIALLIATLLAVLGAFAATHSIHLARVDASHPARLAALAPTAGGETRADRALPLPAVIVTVRADIGGAPTPIAGWAFPLALFGLWALGFAAIVLNRKLARWIWRRIAASRLMPRLEAIAKLPRQGEAPR